MNSQTTTLRSAAMPSATALSPAMILLRYLEIFTILCPHRFSSFVHNLYQLGSVFQRHTVELTHVWRSRKNRAKRRTLRLLRI
jgi:hypothetical protein